MRDIATNEIISIREIPILLERVRVESKLRLEFRVIFVRQVKNKRFGVTFAARMQMSFDETEKITLSNVCGGCKLAF